MVRWEHNSQDSSEVAIQGYFNRESRSEGYAKGVFQTMDLEFQQRFNTNSIHDLVWSLGYRLMSDHVEGQSMWLIPDRRKDDIYSAFLQDDIVLVEDQLIFTIGTKIQHNSYTGVETQPSVRALWTPNDRQVLWSAVSRAVRTPSRYDHDLRIDFQIPQYPVPNVIGRLSGNREFGSESVIAYEAGYRQRFSDRFAADIAAFYNDYDRLQSFVEGIPYFEVDSVPRMVFPITFGNNTTGASYGLEAAANWRMSNRWKLAAGYTWIHFQRKDEAVSAVNSGVMSQWHNPDHQAHLRSYWDVSKKLSFDTSAYYVSSLEGVSIPAYLRLDSRLGWRLTQEAELSVALQNLLDDRHPEYLSEDITHAFEVGRSAYLKLTWWF